MLLSEFSFELPKSLIALRPTEERDGARLLHLDRAGGLVDRKVVDWPGLLPQGALVVLNDTKVLAARLLGVRRPTGGKVELLLVRRLESGEPAEGEPVRFEAMARSSKAMRLGTEVVVDDGAYRMSARVSRERGEDGLLEVELTPSGGTFDEVLERLGHIPLPPYIARDDDPSDRLRYQTIFAEKPGAIAAPTAGLHLSHAMLEACRARGVTFASVTLHVSLGTFQSVKVRDLDDHPMHSEWFDVPEATVAEIRAAKETGRPVVAVGTTAVRALESASASGTLRAGSGTTNLLIQPGYTFRVVDRLLTNFHLPESTLLALVSAFGGTARVRAAYAHAIASRYRFFSYGDAMYVEPGL